MRYLSIILLSFIVSNTWGQSQSDSLVKRPSLYYLTTEASFIRLVGDFQLSKGFYSHIYTLEVDNTFREVEVGCLGMFVRDSGFYQLNPPHQVVFISKKERLAFDIYHYADYFFLVKPSEKEQFITEFDKAVAMFGKKHVYKIGEEVVSSTYLTAYTILQRYFTKGVK